MKKFLFVLCLLSALPFITQCNQKGQTYKCDLDKKKNPYDKAAQYDDCLALNAQIMATHIESTNIDVSPVEYTEFGVFESNFAEINAEENWVKPIYIFFPQDMTGYADAPATINGAAVIKMVAKDKVDDYFGITDDESQGLCADVQQVIYDNVLNNILTKEQRDRYLSEGKSLSLIPDTFAHNAEWVGKDPASLITHDGDNYFFEPYSLYISYYDQTANVTELLRGVKYCKLLSHQAILSWMLQKSFEADPVLLTPIAEECEGPTSLEARGGSCLLYFSQAQSYYCSDFTGLYFNYETGEAKCLDWLDTSKGVLDPIYSTMPCSERTAEIEASIPGYMGLTGICVIHCNQEDEFLWNIYTENPARSCTGFDLYTPEQLN
jgi:hypothetical protein